MPIQSVLLAIPSILLCPEKKTHFKADFYRAWYHWWRIPTVNGAKYPLVNGSLKLPLYSLSRGELRSLWVPRVHWAEEKRERDEMDVGERRRMAMMLRAMDESSLLLLSFSPIHNRLYGAFFYLEKESDIIWFRRKPLFIGYHNRLLTWYDSLPLSHNEQIIQ